MTPVSYSGGDQIYQLILDRAGIDAALRRPGLSQRFTFFRKQKLATTCCGRVAAEPDYDFIKAAILNLSPPETARLKAALNVTTLVMYRDGEWLTR